MNALVAIIVAYLLGSIPFSYLVVKARTRQDIRKAGSGNVGAANVLRVAGKTAALLAFIGDVVKGLAAVFFARWLGDSLVVTAAAVAAVLGHLRPIFLRSGGGKGAATGLGALFALAPAVGVMCLIVLASVIAWTRYVSVGTIAAATMAPWLVVVAQRLGWVEHDPGWSLPIAVTGIAILVVIRHRPNLERLRTGQEPKIGERVRPRR